jgi:hypothetical protein
LEAVDEDRDIGCVMLSDEYAHEKEGALEVESRDEERAMSKEVAGGEMFEYGDVKNGGLLYFDIVVVKVVVVVGWR